MNAVKSKLGSFSLLASRKQFSTIITKAPCYQINVHSNIASNARASITTNSWASERLQEKGEKLETVDSQIQVLSAEILMKPSEKVTKLSDDILSLNMLEVNQLLKVLTTRLGISDEEINVHSFGRAAVGGGAQAAAGAAAAAAPAEPVEPPKPKEVFDLKLVSYDAKNKIKVIKEVRTVTNLGLKEAKELVEKVPAMLKEGLKKDEAENFKKILTDAGAVVELL